MVTAADGDPDNAPGEVAYDDVKMAVCSLRSSTFENGETIVREGTTDNRFYYLMDGEVEVSCRSIEQDKKLTQPIVLRRLKSGSVFGEAELLKPGGNVHPRFSSYKCVAPSCKVLTLLQDDLAAITGVFSEINSKIQGRVSEHAHEQLIKSIQHAKGHVRRVHYEKGDKIVVEGENSDLFYIIVDGKVQVTQQGSVLETLSTGEYFPLGVSGRLQKQNIVQVRNFLPLPYTNFYQISVLQQSLAWSQQSWWKLVVMHFAVSSAVIGSCRHFSTSKYNCVLRSVWSKAVLYKCSH